MRTHAPQRLHRVIAIRAGQLYGRQMALAGRTALELTSTDGRKFKVSPLRH